MAGTYVKFIFSEYSNILLGNLQKELRIRNPNRDLHTTLMYTRNNINWNINNEYPRYITTSKFDVFTTQKGNKSLVLLLDKFDWIMTRFNETLSMGATWDYPEYNPHITLTYKEDKLDVDQFIGQECNLMIFIVNEVVEDLDDSNS